MKCCLELEATPALQTLDVFWMLQIRFKIKVIHTAFVVGWWCVCLCAVEFILQSLQPRSSSELMPFHTSEIIMFVCLFSCLFFEGSYFSVVIVVTNLQTGRSAVRTLTRDRDFSLFLTSRLSLGPVQPAIESIPEFFPGDTVAGEWRWPVSSSADFKNQWSYTSCTPTCLHMQLYYILGRFECSGNIVVYKTVSLVVGAFPLQPRPGTLALGLQNSRQLESSSAQMWLFIARCFVDTEGLNPDF